MNKFFKNKVFLIILAVILLLVAGLGIFFAVKKSINKDDIIKIEDKNISNTLKFKNITVDESEGVYTLKGTMVSSINQNMSGVFIIFKDKDGNEIVRLYSYIGNMIKENEKIEVNASTGIDFTKYDSIEFDIVD